MQDPLPGMRRRQLVPAQGPATAYLPTRDVTYWAVPRTAMGSFGGKRTGDARPR